MKKITLWVLYAFYFVNCTPNFDAIQIRQFFPYKDFKQSDTVNRIEYYIVNNYVESPQNDSIISQYARLNRNSSWMRYNSYQMLFYKESDQTNEKVIAQNPKILDRYSQENDMIYSYSWSLGKYLGCLKFKNGEPQDTGITIED